MHKTFAYEVAGIRSKGKNILIPRPSNERPVCVVVQRAQQLLVSALLEISGWPESFEHFALTSWKSKE
jgi:hypothetical protein